MLIGLALVLLGVAVPLGITLRPTVVTRPPAASPNPMSQPPRPPFVLPLVNVAASSTGRVRHRAARDVAAGIQTTLSRFYDRVFLDPLSWKNVPDDAWDAFAPSVRDRAISDAKSLTPGDIGPQLAGLAAGRSSLGVRVLLDPRGRPHAAIANVVFRADGTLLDGDRVEVVGQGSYLLRPGRGGWLIVGYPSATVTVRMLLPEATRRLALGIPSPQAGPSS
ncbi:MAG: hypothetical protein ACRDGU_01305 [Actinomycetota bacterium]